MFCILVPESAKMLSVALLKVLLLSATMLKIVKQIANAIEWYKTLQLTFVINNVIHVIMDWHSGTRQFIILCNIE